MPTANATYSSLRLRFGLLQRRGVDAVSQSRWLRYVREDVAQVGVAAAAEDFGAAHEEAAVVLGGDRVGGHGLVEAGPAGAGVELGVGGEQGVAAAHERVSAGFFRVVVLARKRPLRAFLAGHVVLLGRELSFPFCVGLFNFLGHLDSPAKAIS